MTTYIKKHNPDGLWFAKVYNFGWRNIEGRKSFEANTGEELLRSILPKTHCRFTVYRYGYKGLAVNNFHHDSPTGEWYYISKTNEQECEKWKV
ncbi:MAG: hypothetical protein GY730_06725 [bacterium]|nr:hypothetical protein [bacterium]